MKTTVQPKQSSTVSKVQSSIRAASVHESRNCKRQENSSSSNEIIDDSIEESGKADIQLPLRRGHDFSQLQVNPNESNGKSDLQHMIKSPLVFDTSGAIPLSDFPIQPKLKISRPDDEFEREADRVADNIVEESFGHIRPYLHNELVSQPIIHRTASENTDDRTHRTALGKFLIDVPSQGQSLSNETESLAETMLGVRLADVRIHVDDVAASAANAIDARAFTFGTHVYFGQGQFDSKTKEGQRLLFHELTHVVQQTGQTAHLQRRALGKRSADDVYKDEEFAPATPKSSSRAKAIAELHDWFTAEIESDPTTKKDADKIKAMVAVAVVGKALRLYTLQGKEIETVSYDGTKQPDWPVGFYREELGGVKNLSIAGYRDEDFIGFSLTPKFQVTAASDWFQVKTRNQILSHLSDFKLLYYIVLPGGNGKGDGEDDQRTSEKTQKADSLVEEVKRKLGESRAANSQEIGKSTTNENKGKQPQSNQIKKIPDRVVHWTDKLDNQWINVWADGAVVAIKLQDGDTTEQLLDKVEKASEALRDARDPAQSQGLAKPAEKTGFTNESDGKGQSTVDVSKVTEVPGGERIANTLAYPSNIVAFGFSNNDPVTTVLGATNHFSMEINYASAGADQLSQVAARMQQINYSWELIDVTGKKQQDEKLRQTKFSESNRVGRGSGVGRDFSRRLDEIGEDTSADIDDLTSGSAAEIALTWPARATWLGVVGVSDGIRTLGSVVSSFIAIVSQPRDEQSVGFSKLGDYVLRCVATPVASDDAQIIRASSVAAKPIRVVNINERATAVNDAAVTKIRKLQAELEKTPDGQEKEDLKKRIERLQKSERANVEDNTQENIALDEAKLIILNRLDAAIESRIPTADRDPDSRLMDVQLQLSGISRDEYRKQLVREIQQLKEILQRANAFSKHYKGPHYRPAVTLASEENGSVTQMLMILGEAKNQQDGVKQWALSDITSPNTQQVYFGSSSQPSIAGHQEAIRNAFINFRENAEYGRGTIAIRLPEAIGADFGGAISIESTMRAAPGTRARVMQRLNDLATAAEIAGLVIAGPAGAAIGIAGAAAGAIVAVDRISRRNSGERLKFWDFETMMDLVAISGVAAAVGGQGVLSLGQIPKWAKRVERIEQALHVYSVGQLGLQVIVIPYQLTVQLNAIDDMKELSPGEKSARRAEAVLQAVRSGAMTVYSAKQMLDNANGRSDESTRDRGASENAANENGNRNQGATQLELPPKAKPINTESGVRYRPDLEKELGDLNGKIRVIERPNLDGAQVNYRGEELVIEVGANHANVQQVRWHLDTARQLLRYKGPLGKVRQLIAKILELLKASPGYGSQGFESKLEVRKLRSIIDELENISRQIENQTQKFGNSDAASAKKQIDAQIAVFEKQLAEHAALVDSYAPGRGFVAAKATTPESLLNSTLDELTNTFPANNATKKGNLIRLDEVIDVRPDLLQDLKSRKTIKSGNATNDLESLMDLTKSLRAGKATQLTPEQRRQLVHLENTYGLSFGRYQTYGGQLTDVGIALIRKQFKGKKDALERQVNDLNDEQIRQQFSHQSNWVEALGKEEFRSDYVGRELKSPKSRALATAPNEVLIVEKSMTNVAELLQAYFTSSKSGLKVDNSFLSQDLIPFIESNRNNPLLQPWYDRCAATYGPNFLFTKIKDPIYATVTDLVGNRSKKIGDMRVDVMTFELGARRLAVTDLSLAYSELLHNFKTAIYLTILEQMMSGQNISVEGKDLRSEFRQTKI